jgi:hypothetical protein
MRPLNEILDDAFRKIGKPSAFVSGENIDAAVSAVNEIFQEWNSRGLLLWSVEDEIIPTVAYQLEYDLPSGVSEILRLNRKDSSGYELPLTQLNRDEYINLPYKEMPGDPLQFFMTQNHENIKIKLWPVPINSVYSLVLWHKRYITEVRNLDDITRVPSKWEPALVHSLASKLYMELPSEEMDINRLQLINSMAETLFMRAYHTESDGSVINFAPNLRAYNT